MNVLFCASEAAPFAASGGLGDVAGSLPRAIRNRKVACRVVMPLYGDMNPSQILLLRILILWESIKKKVFKKRKFFLM